MSKLYKWMCDGCDKVKETPKDISPFNETLIRIGCDQENNPVGGCSFDLCVDCVERLKTKIDPRLWTRFAKMEPPK